MDHDHSHVKIDRNAIGISFLIGISLNLIFTCIEIYFGWNYESTALLSDAVHNLSDVSGLVIAFIAFYLQKIKPSKTLSYGYKKSTILASGADPRIIEKRDLLHQFNNPPKQPH